MFKVAKLQYIESSKIYIEELNISKWKFDLTKYRRVTEVRANNLPAKICTVCSKYLEKAQQTKMD